MAVVVQTSPVPQANRAWSSTICSWCAAPGGCGLCCYVMCCPCCAAGDVAKAGGRDFCMSCCVIPMLLGPIIPCWWAADRSALAQRFGIADPYGFYTNCLLFCCGCGPCLLCQELNTIKDFEIRGITAASNVTQTMVITTAAPGQQTMAAAPQMPGSATHGGRV